MESWLHEAISDPCRRRSFGRSLCGGRSEKQEPVSPGAEKGQLCSCHYFGVATVPVFGAASGAAEGRDNEPTNRLELEGMQ